MARSRKTANIEMAWTSIPALEGLLKSLPASVQKKALRRATREVAKITKDQAVAEAPEDTGQLIKSLKVQAARRSKAKRFKHIVGTNVVTEEGLFQGDTFYAGFMEFGTDARYTKDGAYRGLVPKNRFSFLRPALWLHQERKRQVFIHALRTWLSQNKDKI